MNSHARLSTPFNCCDTCESWACRCILISKSTLGLLVGLLHKNARACFVLKKSSLPGTLQCRNTSHLETLSGELQIHLCTSALRALYAPLHPPWRHMVRPAPEQRARKHGRKGRPPTTRFLPTVFNTQCPGPGNRHTMPRTRQQAVGTLPTLGCHTARKRGHDSVLRIAAGPAVPRRRQPRWRGPRIWLAARRGAI